MVQHLLGLGPHPPPPKQPPKEPGQSISTAGCPPRQCTNPARLPPRGDARHVPADPSSSSSCSSSSTPKSSTSLLPGFICSVPSLVSPGRCTSWAGGKGIPLPICSLSTAFTHVPPAPAVPALLLTAKPPVGHLRTHRLGPLPLPLSKFSRAQHGQIDGLKGQRGTDPYMAMSHHCHRAGANWGAVPEPQPGWFQPFSLGESQAVALGSAGLSFRVFLPKPSMHAAFCPSGPDGDPKSSRRSLAGRGDGTGGHNVCGCSSPSQRCCTSEPILVLPHVFTAPKLLKRPGFKAAWFRGDGGRKEELLLITRRDGESCWGRLMVGRGRAPMFPCILHACPFAKGHHRGESTQGHGNGGAGHAGPHPGVLSHPLLPTKQPPFAQTCRNPPETPSPAAPQPLAASRAPCLSRPAWSLEQHSHPSPGDAVSCHPLPRPSSHSQSVGSEQPCPGVSTARTSDGDPRSNPPPER